jgi:hypothetical protein
VQQEHSCAALPCLNDPHTSKSRSPVVGCDGVRITIYSCLSTSSVPRGVDTSSMLGSGCQYCQFWVLKPPGEESPTSSQPESMASSDMPCACCSTAAFSDNSLVALSELHRCALIRNDTKTMMLPRHEYWHCAASTSGCVNHSLFRRSHTAPRCHVSR